MVRAAKPHTPWPSRFAAVVAMAMAMAVLTRARARVCVCVCVVVVVVVGSWCYHGVVAKLCRSHCSREV